MKLGTASVYVSWAVEVVKEESESEPEPEPEPESLNQNQSLSPLLLKKKLRSKKNLTGSKLDPSQ